MHTLHAKLQIHNNAVEQAIRPITIGHKNYLFAGSHDVAQQVAMIYSLFATWNLHYIDPYSRLKDVLEKMHVYTILNLHELLQQNWKPLTSGS